MRTKILQTTALVLFFHCANAQVTYTLITSGLSSVTFGSGASEIELGDIDGDGDLDIATIGDHGSPNIGASEGGIMIWKNNGTGTNWSLSKSGNFGYGGVALGDVNNDGKMDIGYGMHHNNSTTDFGNGVLEVSLGDGSGASWTPYDDSLGAQGQSWGMFGVDFGDINNDGLLDIGSNGFGCCDGIWLYKNLGNGTWQVTDGNLGGNSNHQFKMGDFNNDGHVDCATANEWGQVWKNKGGGVITGLQNGIPDDPYMTFDIADVNNDGAKDIAVESSSGAKVYFYNKAASAWQSISAGLPSTGVEGVELADMDMDGKCDLVSWSTTGIIIYKGDAAGNWSPIDTIAATMGQYGMSCAATGDLNKDGYTDLVYLSKGSTGSNVLRVYLSSVATHSLNVLPVFPKGYECFVPGSVQFLSWLSSELPGPASTITIEFSSAGNSGPWSPVVSNAPNSGSFQWIVPAVNSSNCYLKYTITQGANNQSVILSNPFGVGSCATPPPTGVNEYENSSLNLVTFPNPMSIIGYVQFTLAETTFTEIKLYDMVGKEVSSIARETLNAGGHTIQFSCAQINSGVYFVKVVCGKVVMESKVVVVHD